MSELPERSKHKFKKSKYKPVSKTFSISEEYREVVDIIEELPRGEMSRFICEAVLIYTKFVNKPELVYNEVLDVIKHTQSEVSAVSSDYIDGSENNENVAFLLKQVLKQTTDINNEFNELKSNNNILNQKIDQLKKDQVYLKSELSQKLIDSKVDSNNSNLVSKPIAEPITENNIQENRLNNSVKNEEVKVIEEPIKKTIESEEPNVVKPESESGTTPIVIGEHQGPDFTAIPRKRFKDGLPKADS